MDKRDIIAGYNAIMPLNLYDIPTEHRKQAIDEHYNDIKKYRMEQDEMSPRLRYENTIGRIHKLHKRDREASEKRAEDKKQQEGNRYHDKQQQFNQCETLHGKL